MPRVDALHLPLRRIHCNFQRQTGSQLPLAFDVRPLQNPVVTEASTPARRTGHKTHILPLSISTEGEKTNCDTRPATKIFVSTRANFQPKHACGSSHRFPGLESARQVIICRRNAHGPRRRMTRRLPDLDVSWPWKVD